MYIKNNLTKELRDKFITYSNNIFVIDSINDQKYTYSEFNILVLKMCSFLEDIENFNGKKVCVITDNDFDTIVLYFALMYVGATAVPVNHKSEIKALEYFKNTLGIRYYFSKTSISNIQTIDYSYNKFSTYTIMKKEPFYDLGINDISIIMHSSGTTGKPKGIMQRISNLYNNALEFSEMVGIDQSNRFLNYLSLTYFGGYYNLMFLPFVNGASFVLSKQFNISMVTNLSKTIDKYEVNTLWLVPSIMSIMNRFDKSSKETLDIYRKKIKLSLVGTAPLSFKLKKEFKEKYNLVPLQNYGLSETFFISSQTKETIDLENTVGKILKSVEVSFDEDNEIIVKTPYLMNGYIVEDIESKNIIKNNTFKTGDIGYIENNMLYLTDRKKDIIIRGGENISPKEIEDVILNCEGVKEVAVIGLEHELFGEDILAFIVTETIEDIKAKVKSFCSKNLGTKKIPSHVLMIKELPKNNSGKIDKNKLKTLCKELI
ncbi:MAG: class I adenylate-forming enzyme family protein [Arcobacter sp.]|uniref:class I adenylate-forming enzyme family protein n=1 Tax=Arcobacter sp. TaxID=1872629 RepID=UPI003AFFE3E1